jgi:hypothetical protein
MPPVDIAQPDVPPTLPNGLPADGQSVPPVTPPDQPDATAAPVISPEAAAAAEQAFPDVVKSCRALKEQYVDTRIDYYKHHTKIPRAMFRWAGVLTIVFSVTLPALAAAVFAYKELILSATSVAIAALTGLSSFYRWDKTWSGNSSAQVALEQHVAKWELEITNAQYLLAPADRNLHVYKATNDLLINSSNVVSSESTGFFRGLQFPQQTTTGRT